MATTSTPSAHDSRRYPATRLDSGGELVAMSNLSSNSGRSPEARRSFLSRTLFEVLLSHPGGLPAAEALSRLASEVELTPREASDYPNRPGTRRFEKEIRFSTIPFVKAGWLRKDKGRWTVTPEGERAYREFTNASVFRAEAKKLYKAWQTAQPAEEEAEDEEREQAVATLDEAKEQASAAIRKYLQSMNAYQFQDLIAALLAALGYYIIWVAPPGPDHGVDILATTDPLGVHQPRLKVQVKRHAEPQPVATVRAFQAVLGDHDVGMFVNVGGFTSGAETEARGHVQRPVTLLDADDVVRLWLQHQENLTHEQRALLPLTAVHYLDLPT